MRRYNNYANREPKEIKAKFDSKCVETGKEIKKGDSCIYCPTNKKVYHHESDYAYQLRNLAMDDTLGYNN